MKRSFIMLSVLFAVIVMLGAVSYADGMPSGGSAPTPPPTQPTSPSPTPTPPPQSPQGGAQQGQQPTQPQQGQPTPEEIAKMKEAAQQGGQQGQPTAPTPPPTQGGTQQQPQGQQGGTQQGSQQGQQPTPEEIEKMKQAAQQGAVQQAGMSQEQMQQMQKQMQGQVQQQMQQQGKQGLMSQEQMEQLQQKMMEQMQQQGKEGQQGGMTQEQMQQMQKQIQQQMQKQMQTQIEQATQQAVQQLQNGQQGKEMTAEQIQELKKAMETAMKQSAEGKMPDISKLGTDIDFNKLAKGTIPDELIPKDGFKQGQVPSEAIPAGFEIPDGMKLPPDTKVDFDLESGKLKTTDGKEIKIPNVKTAGYQLTKGKDGMPAEMPVMDDGRVVPVSYEISANAQDKVSMPQVDPQVLKDVLGISVKAGQSVDPGKFAEKFKKMDMSKLDKLGAESLDSLFNAATAAKLDITKPEVQARMDKVYEERNKQLGVGDVEEKLKILNKNAPEVLSISVESLDEELGKLKDMKAKGITDPEIAKKVDDAIAKCIDAKNSQLRLNGIRQQVAQLMEVKQKLVERSERILTQISKSGELVFSPQEQKELEEEIKASGSGSVTDQAAKIKSFIEKYSKKVSLADASSGDYVKLAALYEKADDMSKAQEVLSSAMADNPDDDAVVLKMAQLYESSNQLDKAADVVEKMLKKNPIPETRAMYAEIKEKQGDIPGAVENVEKAIKDDPGNKDYYDKLDMLYGKDESEAAVAFINGKKVAPVVKNGKSLISVKDIASALDGKLITDGGKTTVEVNGIKVQLTSGSNKATINGKTVTLSSPATTENGVLCIPPDVFAQLGKEVKVYGDTNMVAIMDKQGIAK